MNNLGIYVQVPFCSSKCSFCNFSSRVAPSSVFDTYSHALQQEIAQLPASYEEAGIELSNGSAGLLTFSVDTVYFGGGTPSLLGAERLRQIVAVLSRGRFRFEHVLEFTLEIAPGSAGHDFLGAARSLGINRLSIGAQSFDDRELSCVGRLHSGSDTGRLFDMARGAGFTNISLDLIAGLPYQTEASWHSSLAEAVRLQPEHISVYLFEIDEKSRLGGEVLQHGTRYHAGAVPGDNFMADAYETARAILGSEGYVQYEISNFARPCQESLHNQKYWQLQPYIGLGAGAHSFDGRRRWSNVPDPDVYRAEVSSGRSPIAEINLLSPEEQLEEFFFLGLRQQKGIDLRWANCRWGSIPVSRWESTISMLAQEGWIERQNERVRLSERAYLVSNEIFQHFLS